jgi:metallothionein
MSGQKCKHPSCSCPAAPGKEYCGQTCQNAKGMTELGCNCGHPGCSGANLAGASR